MRAGLRYFASFSRRLRAAAIWFVSSRLARFASPSATACTIASCSLSVLPRSARNSFGATAIYITGKLWLKSFLSGSGVKDLSYLMEKYKFKTTDFNIIHL